MTADLSRINKFLPLSQNNYNEHVKVISFAASSSRKSSLPKAQNPTPKEEQPVNLPGVPFVLATKIIEAANKSNNTVGEYLNIYLKHLTTMLNGTIPEPSVTAKVGKSKVTTLIDSEQIFNKVQSYLKSAKKSIQIEMFEFQNLKVDGDLFPSKGAETVPGWEQQQEIPKLLIKKKLENPDLNIQIILDVHKWYQDGLGNYKRHYNNVEMIKFLKDLKNPDSKRADTTKKILKSMDLYNEVKNKTIDIDVVPYPRAHQDGTVLQHVKFLAVDSRKIIMGGMNWGNHSPANHDACIAIETLPHFEHSEADNLIAEIFDKDWTFAWQRLGKTKFVHGPTIPEEQDNYRGRNRKILHESVEYVKSIGEIFGTPEYKKRYEKGELNLPEVKPVDNPEIQILTNSPSEYTLIKSEGTEEIGDYVKKRLDTATSLKTELFVLSHKEVVNKIIDRYKEAQKGGRPFNVEIIVHPGIVDDFPYCRKAQNALAEAGVPLRMYKANEEIQQRMHSKWALFDDKELLIGSANWSVMALESNIGTGLRPDYPLTNDLLDKEIFAHKPRIDELEKKLGLPTLFNDEDKIDLQSLKKRRASMKSLLKKLKLDDTISEIELEETKIKLTKDRISNIKNLIGYYKLISIYEHRKNTYKRGNHECAVVIKNSKIAKTFMKQFDKDWDYSEAVIPDGYGNGQNDISKSNINFTGKKQRDFIKAKEPTFDRMV